MATEAARGSEDPGSPRTPRTPPLAANVHAAMAGSSIHDAEPTDSFSLSALASVQPVRLSSPAFRSARARGFGLENSDEKEDLYARGALRERHLDTRAARRGAYIHPSLLSPSSPSLSLSPLPPFALDLASRGELHTRTQDPVLSVQSQASDAPSMPLPVSQTVDIAARGDLRTRTEASVASPLADIASASASAMSSLATSSHVADLAERGTLRARDEDTELTPPPVVPAAKKLKKRKPAPIHTQALPQAAANTSAILTRGQLRQREAQTAQSQPDVVTASPAALPVASSSAQPSDAAERGTLRRRV